MNNADVQIQMLRAAELQFRLACTVWCATTNGTQPLDLPSVWTFGKYSIESHEMALTPEGASFAAQCLERSTTYLLAVQIKEALTEWTNHKAREHPQLEVRFAFEIARLIRNGFAHHPMRPVWNIDEPCESKVYSVDGVITLDTTHLDGRPFEWQDYGGPIALLRLSEFVRTKILGDQGAFGSSRNRDSILNPTSESIRQGAILLNKLG